MVSLCLITGLLPAYCELSDELDAWGWCIETTQRDGMVREEGGGRRFRTGNMCIPVADSC